jgi:hypothetical protein
VEFSVLGIFGAEVFAWLPALGGHYFVAEALGIVGPFCVVWVVRELYPSGFFVSVELE